MLLISGQGEFETGLLQRDIDLRVQELLNIIETTNELLELDNLLLIFPRYKEATFPRQQT